MTTPAARDTPFDQTELWRADPDRMLAAGFAGPALRADLSQLYALHLELARIAERTREEMVGRIRLAWWGEALSEALAGGAVRAHPVLEAAVSVLARLPDAGAVCAALVEARESDFVTSPFATWAELETYLEATAGGVARLALGCCGVGAPQAAHVGAAVGRAWGLCGVIRAEPYWQRRGRQLWPDEDRDEAVRRARRALADAQPAVRQLLADKGPAGFPAIGYLALVPGYLATPQRPRPVLVRQARLAAAALFGAWGTG